MKKVFVAALIISFCLNLTASLFAAEEKSSPSIKPQVVSPEKAVSQSVPPAVRSAPPGFGVIMGSIVSVDNSDPEKPKLEVKDDTDNKVHVVELTPVTNIAKVVDASELKAGEKVRVMARKSDDKEIAMAIMFGKIQNLPRPFQPAQPTLQPTQPLIPQPAERQEAQTAVTKNKAPKTTK